MHQYLLLVLAITTHVGSATQLLIRFRDGAVPAGFLNHYGGQLALVSPQSGIFKWSSTVSARSIDFADDAAISHVQKNHPVYLLTNPSLEANRANFMRLGQSFADGPAYPDNPAIQTPEQSLVGEDLLLTQAWGLFQIRATIAWQKTKQGKGITVAITDTGIDYNHEDLAENIWRNPGEIAEDGVDNDQNGFIDDVVGWDFSSNDKFPYDLSMSIGDVLFKGGNPGHGTHVAGVVASQLRNKVGTAGVAPRANLMALRFINELGKGDTAGAIASIDYAVTNGAKIINASWGSEGEEEGDDLLREAIDRAHQKGVIFVAAAGNGRVNPQTFQAIGYDNDIDAKPMVPASYPHENIVAVAALTSFDALAPFSNFGKRSVDLGAPGMKIMSTVPGNRYQDTLIDIGQLKITWDGTSMAAPFVSGALAAVWSSNRRLSAAEVIRKVLMSTKMSSSLVDKVVTDGRLELGDL